MKRGILRPPVGARLRRVGATLAVAALMATLLVRPTQDVVANGETRSLSLRHMHTGETIDITFKKNGVYDREALKKLNWFLRDWRRDEPTRMDPRLFDIVWAAYREVGASERIHVVSAYRSPETNAALRRRSRGVAKFSQHMVGKAMDFYIPGVATSKIRVAALRLQRGGVGFYPTAHTPFVHLDAGSVRMWPRMTRQQLAAVFPDGKTVYLPADGKPMPGYQAAYAEIKRSGGVVAAGVGDGDEDGGPSGIAAFFAGLFGNGNNNNRPARETVVASNSEDNQREVVADVRRPRGESALPSQTVLSAGPEADEAAGPATATPKKAAPIVVASAVPLPVKKPADLAKAAVGVKMVWQDGPEGGHAVPVPPVRPDLPPEPPPAATLVAEAVPPSRPETVDDPVADLLAAADLGPAAFAPTPPERGLAFAAAEPPSAPIIAALPVPVPLPPERPAMVATRLEDQPFVVVAAATPLAVEGEGLSRPDIEALDGMFQSPSRIAAIEFGVGAYPGLTASHFAGPAVKPVRLAVIVDPRGAGTIVADAR